ncbi:hypothetical protein BV22DRAFT_1000978, partial [Leucogyrophana mollusca]
LMSVNSEPFPARKCAKIIMADRNTSITVDTTMCGRDAAKTTSGVDNRPGT